jgi:hypothetical protein
MFANVNLIEDSWCFWESKMINLHLLLYTFVGGLLAFFPNTLRVRRKYVVNIEFLFYILI